MRRFLVLVVLLSACSASATAVVDMVGASQANGLVRDSAVVLDIRTPEEFAEGHIEVP